MGKEEVIKCLEKEGKALSCNEIAEILRESKIKIAMILRRLVKHKEVFAKEIDTFEAREKYNSLRRLNIYYIKEI
jgi:hypothetical protein